MLTLQAIRLADHQARARYTYKHDPIKHDNWKSYHEFVLQGKAWSDDCDSLSSTVANLLIHYGHPLNRIWFAHVDSDHDANGIIDHMIAFTEDDVGELWVIGDTFGPCYRAANMRHRLRKFCNVSNIEAWYEGSDIRQLRMVRG